MFLFLFQLAVISSEKERRLARLRAHYRNDTWAKRTAPPEDWSKPLPEWMAKRDENTYLAQMAKELKEGKIENTKSFCAIMWQDISWISKTICCRCRAKIYKVEKLLDFVNFNSTVTMFILQFFSMKSWLSGLAVLW